MTMFLRNGWYAAIWSNELKDRPIGRTLLNDKVVLFRNASGRAAALADFGPQRRVIST
jgi:vanillate O-demethylase monooxygenase subunit